MGSDVVSLADLGARRGEELRVQGRVVDEPAEANGRLRVRLFDASGSVELSLVSAPPKGAWVEVEGVFDGDAFRGTLRSVVDEAISRFAKTDGDWLALRGGASPRLGRLQQRARILRGLRRYFEERDFLEVETPLAVPSPGLDEHLDAFEVKGFAAPRWLITSPEYQMKRVLAAGAPRIFQTCRCFRRDEEGSNHEPEFTMLEWYRSFADSEAVMRDTEGLTEALAREVLGTTVLPGRGVDVAAPWERLRVEEAFARYAGIGVWDVLGKPGSQARSTSEREEREERFFRILVEDIEPHLGKERPVFLTHYPASMASLARLVPGDEMWAERFEAYVDGIELCNGFGELIDPKEQRRRLLADQQKRRTLGLAEYPVDERFLGALEEGLPPCSGNALGFDRLVMLLLGAPSIQDVIAIEAARL